MPSANIPMKKELPSLSNKINDTYAKDEEDIVELNNIQ